MTYIERLLLVNFKAKTGVTRRETGKSEVGSISKAQEAQFLNYTKNVFMKSSCFRTSEYSLD